MRRRRESSNGPFLRQPFSGWKMQLERISRNPPNVLEGYAVSERANVITKLPPLFRFVPENETPAFPALFLQWERNGNVPNASSAAATGRFRQSDENEKLSPATTVEKDFNLRFNFLAVINNEIKICLYGRIGIAFGQKSFRAKNSPSKWNGSTCTDDDCRRKSHRANGSSDDVSLTRGWFFFRRRLPGHPHVNL